MTMKKKNISISVRIVITVLKGIVEFLFQTTNAFRVHVIALILICDVSSALLGPKIAMKVILDPKMCEI